MVVNACLMQLIPIIVVVAISGVLMALKEDILGVKQVIVSRGVGLVKLFAMVPVKIYKQIETIVVDAIGVVDSIRVDV
jgi:hypothetical protein